MHCDVCLDRLPKLPAFDDASNHPSMQDRFLEFGASPLLHACQTYLNRAWRCRVFLPSCLSCPRISRRLKPLTLSCRSSISFGCPEWESRNLRNATGTFWSAPWRAALAIDLHSVSRCHVLVVPNEKEGCERHSQLAPPKHETAALQRR